MWKRCSRQMMTDPKIQITIIGQTTLPHWMLKLATVPEARNEHGDDAEVRWIPEVPAVRAKHVLRRDRNQRCKGRRARRPANASGCRR